MIAQLEGKIAHKDLNFLILSVGGIGYQIYMTTDAIADFALTDKSCLVWIYEAIREDSHDLYGFKNAGDLKFFELLLSVSGIGPKSALAIMNVAPAKILKSAIASGDPSRFSKSTGIGTKKAEKIILELKDKIDISETDLASSKGEADVLEALKALGYSDHDGREALKNLPKENCSTEQKIKLALKSLGK